MNVTIRHDYRPREEAILEGFRVFRELRRHGGGMVTVDLLNRDLGYRKRS